MNDERQWTSANDMFKEAAMCKDDDVDGGSLSLLLLLQGEEDQTCCQRRGIGKKLRRRLPV